MLRLIAFLLLVLGCSPSISGVRDSIVALQQGGDLICAGFAISEHEVVTAAHCLEFGPVNIVTRDQYDRTVSASTPTSVVYVDEDRDLAVLRSSASFVFPFRMREPLLGEIVTAVSAVYGWTHSDGFVLPGFGYFADTTMTIRKGWSGSPVIGRDGYAVGIVSRCMANQIDGKAVCLPNNMQFSVLP